MRRSELVEFVGKVTHGALDDTDVQEIVDHAIRDVINSEQYHGNIRSSWFTTIEPYTTGTVTVTNGSRTVAGDSTVWTASMVNRRFYVGNQKYWIESVDTGNQELTLDRPYAQDTESEASYTIDQPFYCLHWKAQEQSIQDMINEDRPCPVLPWSRQMMVDRRTLHENSGDARYYAYPERNQRTWTYDTGTVDASSGNNYIEGTGTYWNETDSHVAPGGTITIGSDTYTIKNIVSNTKLYIYDTVTNDASGSSYEISCDYPFLQVLVDPVPDGATIFPYKYTEIAMYIEEDNDVLPFPLEFHSLIEQRAKYLALERHNKDDTSIERANRDFEQGKNSLINKKTPAEHRLRRRRWDEDETPPSLWDGLNTSGLKNIGS